MKMDRRERKYQRWTTDAPVGVALEISVDNVIWTPVVNVGGIIEVLFRGPDAPAYAGAVDIPLGTNAVRFRATDNPEIEIDKAGTVVCE